MKHSFALMLVSLLFLFICEPAQAQDPPPAQPIVVDEVVARVTPYRKNIFTEDQNGAYDKFTTEQSDWVMSNNSFETSRVLRPGHFLVARFYSRDQKGDRNLVSIQDSGVQTVKFSRQNGTTKEVTVSGFANKTYIIVPFPDEVLSDASHNETITVEIHRKGASGPDLFYSRYNENLQSYGAYGLWIPVGLFSSNLHESDTGLVFAAQPVNIALGGRWLPGESDFYLGASIAGGWAISSRTDVPESDDGAAAGFTLATISGTLLFDINSLVYLGPTYIADFRAGKTDPGFALSVGFGPKLLTAIAGLSE